MGLFNVRVSPYVPNLVRCFKCQKFGHDKGKLKCVRCGEEDHEGFDFNNDPKCSNCGQPHMASSKDCQFFKKETEIQKIKTEKYISYPEARRFVTATNDSNVQKSYASVIKPVFTVNQLLIKLNYIKKDIKFISNSQHFKKDSYFNFIFKQ